MDVNANPNTPRYRASQDVESKGDHRSSIRRIASPGAESIAFVREQGANGSIPTYQVATGAPVEKESPLGYEVNWISIIFLNISQMVGTGVFSTPSSILSATGSVGMSFIYWVLGLVISCCSLGTYLELASYFPSRSGSEIVYLENAYPRPKWFFPTAFAVQTVILSFSSSNAVVLAQYLFKMADHEATAWDQKGVAVTSYTIATIFMIANTRFSLHISNAIGLVKVLTLVFISIAGLVCLGGNTKVADPMKNFHNAFAGTSSNGYSMANALVKITFSYSGYQNAFNDPVKTIRKSAPAALLVVAILYILCNVAYFAAVPAEEILASEQTVASLFFSAIFGTQAARGLNFLVVLSAFGNLLAVLIGQSRVIREIGRQGMLPWTSFWVSTKPFGTPLGPYLLKWAMTVLMILAPPAGDAFNFIVDLQTYPSAVFIFLMTLGLYFIRRQRKRIGAGRSGFRCWDSAIIFTLAVNLFLLIMPWYPPLGGATRGDVSFWYGTYCVVGIGIILACIVYYWLWIFVLPYFGGYKMRQKTVTLDDGSVLHQLVKVPNSEIRQWDEEHDAVGNVIGSGGEQSVAQQEKY
ncbi:amino acid transporter-like protein [Phyllosticta citrichinensis]|uniref:Amino acid transporter-like protein n=1 Tax=Phyllosticta citrichinensis TaxID=1130410 RepID=A0ABR1XX04_9PEZI